jgi:hypothetical protein
VHVQQTAYILLARKNCLHLFVYRLFSESRYGSSCQLVPSGTKSYYAFLSSHTPPRFHISKTWLCCRAAENPFWRAVTRNNPPSNVCLACWHLLLLHAVILLYVCRGLLGKAMNDFNCHFVARARAFSLNVTVPRQEVLESPAVYPAYLTYRIHYRLLPHTNSFIPNSCF